MNGFLVYWYTFVYFACIFSRIKKEDFLVLDWFGNRIFWRKKHRYQNGVAATNIVNFVSVKQGFESSKVFLLKVVICCRSIWFDMTIGPNLDLICVRQSDAAPFPENFAKLYFDAKHLVKFLVLFFQKSVLFDHYWTLV